MNENCVNIDRTLVATPSSVAPRKILKLLADAWCEQIKIMEQEKNGVKSGDVEALHRFRVAIRKTRTLLKLFSPSLSGTQQLSADFDWMATLTNPIRDADIILQDSFAADNRQALSILLDKIKANRYDALQGLIAALDSRRYRLLIVQWRTYLSELPTKKMTPRWREQKSRDFLFDMLLMQMHQLLKKLSHSQGKNTSSRKLHKLRIRSKRLRYFIESFPQLLQNTRVEPVHKRLKQLQTILGQHQDSVMTVTLLRRQAEVENNVLSENDAAKQILDKWITQVEDRQQIARAYYRRVVVKLASASNRLAA